MNIKLRASISSALKDVTEVMFNGVDGKGSLQSCLTCKNFDEQTEICRRFNQRPPARIIVFACEHYEDIDDVPF